MLGGNYSTTPRAPARKERKVSVVFRPSDELKHCAGVECVLPVPETDVVFTASRDSTIKRWSVSAAGQVVCDASFDGHADWVNDLACAGPLLFSCSNDKTVRVWDPVTGHHHEALTHHSDYVTCLATSPGRASVVSAGLRGEIFVIDIGTGSVHKLRPAAKPGPGPATAASHAPAYGTSRYAAMSPEDHALANGSAQAGGAPQAAPHKASIYSLAASSNGNVVAAGSSDSIIRLWDTRSQEKVAKLRGHTDNVRSLLLSPDCSMLLSGSADGSIKLWDLSMQRCVQTYVVHSDSVWSLHATPDWSTLYSAGKDRAIYRTHLTTRKAELLALEQHPITCIAYTPRDRCFWAATTSSSINLWHLSKSSGTQPDGSVDGRSISATSRVRILSASPNSTRADPKAALAGREPLLPKPAITLPGLPSIVQHKVLSDRRHILTKDVDGNVSRWDVLAGTETGRFGKADMDEVERRLFEAHHCPSWFVADTRLGQLAITLEPPHCFNAEEYAQALEYPDATEDEKVNLGKLVLDGAFAQWRQQQLRAVHMEGPGQPGSPQSPTYPEQAAPGPGPAQPQPPYQGLWPRYWQGVQPAVICQNAQGVLWRKLINQFSARDSEPDTIPAWVGDVVIRQAPVQPKESKIAFILLPMEGSGLPNLLQSRLNAPRILQVHKVVQYCQNKLEDVNIRVWPHPYYFKPPLHPPLLNLPPPGTPVQYELELTCNNVVVPFDLSLSSVKKFIWCKPDDLVFHYNFRNPANPAPLPDIRPPAQTQHGEPTSACLWISTPAVFPAVVSLTSPFMGILPLLGQKAAAAVAAVQRVLVRQCEILAGSRGSEHPS